MKYNDFIYAFEDLLDILAHIHNTSTTKIANTFLKYGIRSVSDYAQSSQSVTDKINKELRG